MTDHTYVPGPKIEWTPEKIAAFEHICQAFPGNQDIPVITEMAGYPRWEFLCYLSEHNNVVFHGSNAPDIQIFEPRNQTDYFGRPNCAVFATRDGIWPIFFAILKRASYQGSLRNNCERKLNEQGQLEKTYFFSINRKMKELQPWTEGTVYVLPAETFECVKDFDGNPSEEWFSTQSIKPLFKVFVRPEDFPFLKVVEYHDDRLIDLSKIVLAAFTKAEALPDGYQLEFVRGAELLKNILEFTAELQAVLPGLDVQLSLAHHNGPVHLRLRESEKFRELFKSWIGL